MRLFKRKEQALPIPPPPTLELDELPKAEHIMPPIPEIPPISVPDDMAVELPQEPMMSHSDPVAIAPSAPIVEKKEPTEKYVEKNDYEVVASDLSTMEGTIRRSQSIMDDLITLKSDADHSLEEWRATLEDVERKLLYVDKVLFESNE